MVQKENFWSDQKKAQSIIKEKNILENRLNSFSSLKKEYDELIEKVRKKEFENFLSGEADPNSCFLEVHSGAGGVEAQDWAEMIVRMYTRGWEKKKLQF